MAQGRPLHAREGHAGHLDVLDRPKPAHRPAAKETCWQELTEEIVEATPSEEAAPEEAVSEGQRKARVQAVLACLPADQREVVTLAFIDGLSQSEIAARLTLPLGTVKSRLRLAYQKVRSALEDLK